MSHRAAKNSPLPKGAGYSKPMVSSLTRRSRTHIHAGPMVSHSVENASTLCEYSHSLNIEKDNLSQDISTRMIGPAAAPC